MVGLFLFWAFVVELQVGGVFSAADLATIVISCGKSRGVTTGSVTELSSDPKLKGLDPVSIGTECVEGGDMPKVALGYRMPPRIE